MDADAKQAWELMEKIGICMLATNDGDAIRSRPMTPNLRRAAGRIEFLTDARRHPDPEIERGSAICLAFSDPGAQRFVSVSGRAQMSADRAEITALWSTPAKAWWDSSDDPNIRVLIVTPHEAEFWEGSGKLIRYVKMAAAAITGAKSDSGESKKVVL
ncbi:MAG: pyridoxamine 5'-phosphate oxidase family protein [Hyphomicrobiales bacterium]|nr:pyridoxamine 5'-phosphate oxidase family protein [Hyphomicrobiales bacterium]